MGYAVNHMLLATAIFATSDSGNWTIAKALKALQQTISGYGQTIVALIGLIMLLVGVYKFAKHLISGGQGRGDTNWVQIGALIIIGGALMLSGGWSILENISKGGKTTIEQIGEGQPDGDGYSKEGDGIDK